VQTAVALILLGFLYGTTSAAETACGYHLKATVSISGAETRRFRVGIADTSSLHRKGLMECSSLPRGQGLLFIFPDLSVRSFWMYRTSMPLAIIFLDDDFRVITVRKGEPNSTLSISSEKPVRYVLEVNWEEGKAILPGQQAMVVFD